jgi:hypothetical protein
MPRGLHQRGNPMTSTLENQKVRGAIHHVISQLVIKQFINQDYADYLKREIGYGRIVGFRHLAEFLLACKTINDHNYSVIIEYGKRFHAI